LWMGGYILSVSNASKVHVKMNEEICLIKQLSQLT